MKKNILQVFASRSWGGGEQYVYDLSERLTDDGYNVFYLSKKSSVIKDKLNNKNLYFLPLKGIIDLYSPFKLCKIVKRYNIEIIHIHHFKDAFTTMFAKFLLGGKLKVVLTRHIVKKAKTGFLYKKAYNSINKIIFVSEFAKSVFLETNPKIDSDKILVIHNSIPNNKIIPYSFNFPTKGTILSFIGRLSPEKGIEFLLEAVSSINYDFTLIIVGTGENTYKSNLENLTNKLGIDNKVKFIGFVDNISGLVQQIDIGIMPSVIRESFGLTALEYMRGGKTVITTNNGAQKEFIINGINGILIPPSNSKILAETITNLIQDKERANTIGMKAMDDFNHKLSYDVFYRAMSNVYNF